MTTTSHTLGEQPGDRLMPHERWVMSTKQCKDAVMTHQLNKLITHDARISNQDKDRIFVQVTNGAVVLHGTVRDPLSMEYAYRDVMSLDDFIWVENHIQIMDLPQA